MNAWPVSRVSHYAALLKTMRERIAYLEVTHDTVDYVAGFPTGYTGKLLGGATIKRMSPFAMFCMADALGLQLSVEENPEGLAKLQSRLVKRTRPQFAPGRKRYGVRFELGVDMLRQMGRRGVVARMAKYTPKQRSEHARKGWQTRLRKVKAPL
jgi:hypothetical protein